MFAVRFTRAFGLAVTLCFLSGAFTATHGQEKKDVKDVKKAKSKLKITVPQDDAKLLIEGKDTKPTGVTREFETPELEVGKAVVRWVPTPDDIVEEMMKLGSIKKGDIVYEPGPGDGRMLIAAVKKGADKGVGIELDPKKAEEARENIKKAKLEKQITIIEGDALKDRDYSEATVILLYMGNEFNNLLRPILEKQLKPGTRIVSHRFVLGDWAPDKTITVTGEDGDEYKLHLWTVKDKGKGGNKK
jgi:hypothetical protein